MTIFLILRAALQEIIYSDYECCQISTLASLSAIAINNAALVEMTTTDAMTQLKLKHFFYAVLTDKLEFSVEHRLPLSLVMFDIDFFKNVNDTYGHACGDTILKDIASLIFKGIRGQDMAARYGGEEFIVMLFDTDEEAAFKVAERIRHVVEEYCFTHESVCIRLTISAGISVFCPKRNPVTVRDLIDQADRALYDSKRNGRNKVTVFNAAASGNVPDEYNFFTFGSEFSRTN
ncbi:GGDEF domain-containing protein [Treponema sp. HNW]|uniref:diguanylate cyclase n=1 Tax=Treponema sp. HNW TaxID=3116654 RepID=UPI003D0DDAC7